MEAKEPSRMNPILDWQLIVLIVLLYHGNQDGIEYCPKDDDRPMYGQLS